MVLVGTHFHLSAVTESALHHKREASGKRFLAIVRQKKEICENGVKSRSLVALNGLVS